MDFFILLLCNVRTTTFTHAHTRNDPIGTKNQPQVWGEQTLTECSVERIQCPKWVKSRSDRSDYGQTKLVLAAPSSVICHPINWIYQITATSIRITKYCNFRMERLTISAIDLSRCPFQFKFIISTQFRRRRFHRWFSIISSLQYGHWPSMLETVCEMKNSTNALFNCKLLFYVCTWLRQEKHPPIERPDHAIMYYCRINFRCSLRLGLDWKLCDSIASMGRMDLSLPYRLPTTPTHPKRQAKSIWFDRRY